MNAPTIAGTIEAISAILNRVLYRPYALVLNGVLHIGLELELEDGVIQEVRPHTGVPESYVLSVGFVNAHSHLEYRGMQDAIDATNYWDWIRELTRRKVHQTDAELERDCATAAQENAKTGVAVIGEHSDRPFSGAALAAYHIGGVIYQEVITFFERDRRKEKLAIVDDRAAKNRYVFPGTVRLAPHAFQTVDPDTLAEIGASELPFSMHVAETPYENELTLFGLGPLAEMQRANGVEVIRTGLRMVPTLKEYGLVRPGAQFVHACDVNEEDIQLMAKGKVTVAHCPRSNRKLRCPDAPVREMLEAGLVVGLGMDSAASGGPIDMFAEMRAAIDVSLYRGRAVSAEEVWRMATSAGYQSLGLPGTWDIAIGAQVPLLKIHVPGAHSTEELMDQATPDLVEWL